MGLSSDLRYHCVKCGDGWGSGPDIDSHGICPKCFFRWAKKKQHCFGEFRDDDVCKTCSLRIKCKEYDGFE